MDFRTSLEEKMLLKSKKLNKLIKNNNLNFIFRVFWIFALLCSFICCLLMFSELIEKVFRNPIVIERPDSAVHIKDVRM